MVMPTGRAIAPGKKLSIFIVASDQADVARYEAVKNFPKLEEREKECARVRCVLETFHDAINKRASGRDS
jgi:hypothetical protein